MTTTVTQPPGPSPCPECGGHRVGVDTSSGMQLVAQATGQTAALRALVCVTCGHTTLYAKEPERMGPRTAAPAVAEVQSEEAAEADALAQRAEEPEAGRQDWLAAEEEAVVQVPGSAMPILGAGAASVPSPERPQERSDAARTAQNTNVAPEGAGEAREASQRTRRSWLRWWRGGAQ